MQGLVNGDLVAKLCQIACGGQAGRACADDGHLVGVPFGDDGGGVHILDVYKRQVLIFQNAAHEVVHGGRLVDPGLDNALIALAGGVAGDLSLIHL